MNFTLSRKYKYHYIRVNDKSPVKLSVARFDVSHLNKKGVNDEWDRIDEMFPKDKYTRCLESSHSELACFNKQEVIKKEKADDLEEGDTFVLPKGRKKRTVQGVWEIEAKEWYPEKDWGKLLVVTTDCKQFVFEKNKTLFIN